MNRRSFFATITAALGIRLAPRPSSADRERALFSNYLRTGLPRYVDWPAEWLPHGLPVPHTLKEWGGYLIPQGFEDALKDAKRWLQSVKSRAESFSDSEICYGHTRVGGTIVFLDEFAGDSPSGPEPTSATDSRAKNL